MLCCYAPVDGAPYRLQLSPIGNLNSTLLQFLVVYKVEKKLSDSDSFLDHLFFDSTQ